jgi:phosphate starvation-inducible membrane PsiE
MSTYDNLLSTLSEKATTAIVITLCAVCPFICDPKGIFFHHVLGKVEDRFGYVKWIALLCVASAIAAVLLLNILKNSLSDSKLVLNVPLLLFTFWCLVATFFSVDFTTSFFGIFCSYQGLVTYVIYLAIFTLVINYYNNDHISYLAYSITIASVLMSLIVIIETFAPGLLDIISDPKFKYATNVRATFGNSNNVGSYFSLMFPFATIMWLHSTTSKDKYVYLASTVINYFGLLYSVSRVSWISATVACVLCILLVRNTGHLVRFCKLTFFLVLATFIIDSGTHIIRSKVENLYTQTTTMHRNLDNFGSSRVLGYKTFIKLNISSAKNMLVGVGPDCLAFFESGNEVFGKAHSDPIEYAATMGLPALLFYALFICSILVPYLKVIGSAPYAVTAVFAAWLGYLIQSFLNSPCISIVEIFMVFSGVLFRFLLTHATRPDGSRARLPVVYL